MVFLRNPRLVSTALCTTICSPAPNSGAWTVCSMAFIRAMQIFITQYPRTHIIISEATITTSVVMINTILTRSFKNCLVVLSSCMSVLDFLSFSEENWQNCSQLISASLWSLRTQEMKVLQIIRRFMLWYWEVSRLLLVNHLREIFKRHQVRDFILTVMTSKSGDGGNLL